MKFIALIILFSLLISNIKALNLVRKTQYGLIRGVLIRSESNSSVEYFAFKAVPYGLPPVGHHRFQEPLPPEEWDEIKDVNMSADYCVQMSGESVIGSEDCLYLDVFEPKSAQKGKLLPVMVWIHGGNFRVGSAKETDPEYLMEKSVIIVSIQYRLNVFGFLSTKDKYAKGNVGLKDQTLALKWVKDNIQGFGGDPNSITIFGESAGGASVMYHMVSPRSKGLFEKAISQSGSTLNRWALQLHPEEMVKKLAEGLGINSNNTKIMVEELQKIDHKILLETAFNSSIVGFYLPYYAQPFTPIIENESETAFISESTFKLLEEGKFHRVPFMLGFNTEEGSLAYYAVDVSIVDINIYEKYPELLIPISMNANKSCYNETIAEIRSFYFKNGSVTDKKNWINYMSEELILRGILKSVEFMYEVIPLYLYEFSYTGTYSFSFLGGVGHYEEVQYLWRLKQQFPNITRTDSDILTIKRMVTMWTNFATTGNPTPENDELLQNTIWPTVKSSRDYLNIGSDLSVSANLYQENYEFWEKLFDFCGNPPYKIY